MKQAWQCNTARKVCFLCVPCSHDKHHNIELSSTIRSHCFDDPMFTWEHRPTVVPVSWELLWIRQSAWCDKCTHIVCAHSTVIAHGIVCCICNDPDAEFPWDAWGIPMLWIALKRHYIHYIHFCNWTYQSMMIYCTVCVQVHTNEKICHHLVMPMDRGKDTIAWFPWISSIQQGR